MMIVALHACVSHLKRKWQHSPTFSWRYCTTQKCLLQKSPPLSIHPFFPLYPSSFISFLYVAISERLLLLLLMGDVNHRCAHKLKNHIHGIVYTYKRKRKRRRARNRDRLLLALLLLLLLSFSIYRCAATQARISSNACTSHTFCLLLLLLLLFLVLTYVLSLFAGISRRRMMTRKERGRDVYGCMLGQTLNDESSQESNPINCTKRRNEE